MIHLIISQIIYFGWAFREALDLTCLLVITGFTVGPDSEASVFLSLKSMIVWIQMFSTQVSICHFSV